MLLTGFIALIFTVLFYVPGSLWLSMLVRALFDLHLLVLLPRSRGHSVAVGGGA